MRSQELLPRHALAPRPRWLHSRSFKYLRDGSPAPFVAEIGQRTLNPGVAPRAVFSRQFYNQFLNILLGWQPAALRTTLPANFWATNRRYHASNVFGVSRLANRSSVRRPKFL